MKLENRNSREDSFKILVSLQVASLAQRHWLMLWSTKVEKVELIGPIQPKLRLILKRLILKSQDSVKSQDWRAFGTLAQSSYMRPIKAKLEQELQIRVPLPIVQ